MRVRVLRTATLLRGAVGAGLVIALGVATEGAASAKIPLPTPGTASQVKALVAASTGIEALPADLVPALAAAQSDTPGNLYPITRKGCATVAACVLGDTTSKRTVVLYGDSHAQMWLPALVPIAKERSLRLIIVWTSACPVAGVRTSTSGCVSFRAHALSAIQRLHASLVILANRTTGIIAPGGALITKAAWQEGMETTIKALQTAATKVTVVGDITQMNYPIPACLASFPTRVQHCAVQNPNPKFTNKFVPEKAAAVATGAGYVNTQPWVCTRRCSPVIGTMVAYSDFGHVSATYAEYLTNVWLTAISPMLPG